MNHLSTPTEIQSGHDRQKWAERLILQLPADHDGRNSWLLNYGRGEEATKLREERAWPWSDEYESAFPKHIHVAGTLVGKNIDTCAHCGADIRNEIHHDTRFSLPLPLLPGHEETMEGEHASLALSSHDRGTENV